MAARQGRPSALTAGRSAANLSLPVHPVQRIDCPDFAMIPLRIGRDSSPVFLWRGGCGRYVPRPERQVRHQGRAERRPTRRDDEHCSLFCSKRHCSRAARKKRKWVERAASVEAVNPFKVFERDGWRCQCCRMSTPRERRGTYHPRAPELDHIVPLSKGGEHSYRNTQLLCRACNAKKSDRDEGQQMRLFG